MSPTSSNLAISFFTTSFFILDEMTKSLLDRLGFGVDVKLMIYQFPCNSWHVRRLPCNDVPIFLEQFDEREFLFGV
jgi:hypothetical protein